MAKGDILFYTPATLTDRIICWRTHGPFCHVEVDVGDGTSIGAIGGKGVVHHGVSYERAVHYSLDTSPERLDAGMVWLEKQVGTPYAWADILNFILPRPMLRLFLGQKDAFTCSNLVARFVDIAGGLDLGNLDTEIDLVSPNDLARAAHLA